MAAGDAAGRIICSRVQGVATEVLGSVRKEEKDEEQRVEGKTPKRIRFVGAPRPASTQMDACQSREAGDADARSPGGLPAFSIF